LGVGGTEQQGAGRYHPHTMTHAAGQSLFVKCTHRGDVLHAKLAGPAVGQRETPIISQALGLEIDGAAELRALVLDFSDVTFLNSMGLGMCIELRGRMQARKGRTILYGLSEQLLQTIKLTKMDRLFILADTTAALEKALK
jgi:anti-anti-sigma factor